MINKQTQSKQNRIRETLDRLYDQQPPLFREQLKKLQQDPTSRVFAPLAESYRRLGRVDEAIEICLRGLEHHPDFHGGRVALAKCFLEKNRYQDAQRELEKVVHLAPENLLAQKLLGEALMAQSQESAALHAFKMALLLAPFDVALNEKVHQLEKQLSNPQPETTPRAPLTTEEVFESSFPDFPMPAVETESHLGDEPVVEMNQELSREFSKTIEPMENFSEISMDPLEEEEISDDGLSAGVNAALGIEEEAEEVFSVAPVSSAFKNAIENPSPEITTETLGDLYFSQGQYSHSLKIFEKISRVRSSPELEKKIKACRIRLGVDSQSQIRKKKIKALEGILHRLQESEKH